MLVEQQQAFVKRKGGSCIPERSNIRFDKVSFWPALLAVLSHLTADFVTLLALAVGLKPWYCCWQGRSYSLNESLHL